MALFGGVMGIYFLVRRRRRRPAIAATGPIAPLPARIRASVAVFFGNMLLARASGVGAAASGAPHAPAIEAGELSNTSPTKSATDHLPYGVAIAVGGLAVAATLLMKG
jgi:Flp pilus assembly protein protease CpaA